VHLEPDLILERVDRFIGEFLPRGVVLARRDLAVESWSVPGADGGIGEPIPFARMRDGASFSPVRTGESWGAPWATWLRVSGGVPSEWRGRGRVELSIDLGFSEAKPGFQCEGLVRLPDGTAVKGLEPRNHHVPLSAAPGEEFEFFVEAASNPDLTRGDDFRSPLAFSATPLGDRATAGTDPLYRYGSIEVRLVDEEVERLLREVRILSGLARELAPTDPRRAAILRGLSEALHAIDPDRIDAAAARERLAPLLASPAAATTLALTATGHAHIDSAWLWPTRETTRKVTRTYANVLALMDEDPDVTFVSSSAQHFAWVRDADPELFARIRARVAEGRFIPVGNMWVESDVNMPSGESLSRQLLYGTRFFEDEFGSRSPVGWLPDSFGYPGSLPQLLRRAGLEWFFTQKMCWNDVNTMPHHSFLWEGTDGSRIFTHFPPTNTYSGDLRPTELARAVRNFADHGGATRALMPFGYGDGGGGPTREMVADARIQSDLEGSARVELGTPEAFFREAEAEYADVPVWSGEMYLEFHRGIFTSQSRTKRGNRRNEQLLVEAELWSAAATLSAGTAYPYDELDELWRDVLLLQFHDILPGTAIAWVHREAERSHAATTERLERIIAAALGALSGDGEGERFANSAPRALRGVPAFAVGSAAPAADVTLEERDGGFRLRSHALEVDVAADGTIVRLVDTASGRDAIAPGHPANVLQLHVDVPAKWDAWELDRDYRLQTENLVGTAVREGDDTVRVDVRAGGSTIVQRISLDESGGAVRIRTQVDWHETRRLLKLAFPVDVHALDAAYETSYGHVRRPLHRNTSWDAARYESCAHRWVHVGEPGFGVAIANDGMYGHDAWRDAEAGRTITTVRQSLLRAPTFPDPDADQGRHEFETLIAPAATTDEALAWGIQLGSPLRRVAGDGLTLAPVRLDGDTSAVVSAVKLAADRSGDLVVRLYESRGARTRARLVWDRDGAIRECDLVEGALDGSAQLDADPRSAELELRPFEVRTFRITLDDGNAR
jgi:alpha-mannosidase